MMLKKKFIQEISFCVISSETMRKEMPDGKKETTNLCPLLHS